MENIGCSNYKISPPCPSTSYCMCAPLVTPKYFVKAATTYFVGGLDGKWNYKASSHLLYRGPLSFELIMDHVI